MECFNQTINKNKRKQINQITTLIFIKPQRNENYKKNNQFPNGITYFDKPRSQNSIEAFQNIQQQKNCQEQNCETPYFCGLYNFSKQTSQKKKHNNQKSFTDQDQTEELQNNLEEFNLNSKQQNEIINIINRSDPCIKKNMNQILHQFKEVNYILVKLHNFKQNQLTFHGYEKIDLGKQKDLIFLMLVNQKSYGVQLQQAISQIEKEKQIIILENQFEFNELYLIVLCKDNYLDNKQLIKNCMQKQLLASYSISIFVEKNFEKLDFQRKRKEQFHKLLKLLVDKNIYLIDYKKEEQQIYHFNGFQVSQDYQDITLLIFLGNLRLDEYKRLKEKYLFLEQKINRKIILDQIQFGSDLQALVLNKNNKKLVEVKKNIQIQQQKIIDQIKFNFNTINNISKNSNQINCSWFNEFQNEIFSSLFEKQYFLTYLVFQENQECQQNQILVFDGYKELNSKINDLTFKIYYKRENKLIDKEFFLIRYYEKKLKNKQILLDYIEVKNDINILALDKQEYNNFYQDIKRDLENQDIQIWDKQSFKSQINKALKNKKNFQKQFDKILDQLIQKNYYLSKCIQDSDKQEEDQQFFTGYQMRSLSQKDDLIFQMQHEKDNQKLMREQNIIEMIETDCQEQIKQDYFKFEENIHVTIFKHQQYFHIKNKIQELKNNDKAFIFDLQKVYQQLKQIEQLKDHKILFTQWEAITKIEKVKNDSQKINIQNDVSKNQDVEEIIKNESQKVNIQNDDSNVQYLEVQMQLKEDRKQSQDEQTQIYDQKSKSRIEQLDQLKVENNQAQVKFDNICQDQIVISNNKKYLDAITSFLSLIYYLYFCFPYTATFYGICIYMFDGYQNNYFNNIFYRLIYTFSDGCIKEFTIQLCKMQLKDFIAQSQ
ncbi:hypothetical protein ABPG72_017543 [Tetrahymena utriculariae]